MKSVAAIIIILCVSFTNAKAQSKQYFCKSTPLLGHVMFSQDGSKMFTWNNYGGTLWNTGTGMVNGNIENEYAFIENSNKPKISFNLFQYPIFSSDSKYIYHFDDNNGISVWNTEEKKVTNSISVSELIQKLERFSSVNDIDGNFEYCAFGSEAKSGSGGTRKIKLYDITQRKVIREMPGLLQHKSNVTSLRIDSKHRQIASGDVTGIVYVWKLNTDSVIALAKFDEETLARHCFFNSAGDRIVVFYDSYSTSSKGMSVFDVNTGERIYSEKLWGISHSNVEYLKECNAVIVRSDSIINVYDVDLSSTKSFTIDDYSPTNTNEQIVISADKKLIAILKSDCTINIYDTKTGSAIEKVQLDTTRVKYSLKKCELLFSPASTELVVTNSEFHYTIDVQNGKLIRAIRGLLGWSLKTEFTQKEGVAFVKDGAKRGHIYDFNVGKYVLEDIFSKAGVCDYNSKTDILAIHNKYTDSLEMYKATSGELIKEIDIKGYSLTNIQFNTEGNHIMIFLKDGSVQVLDVDKGLFLYEYKLASDQIRKTIYSANNNRCLVLGSEQAVMYNTNTGEKITTIPGLDTYSNIKVNPIGDQIITLNSIYSGNTGALVKKLVKQNDTETGGEMTFGVFLNDGKRAVTGSQNKLFIWNIENGELLKKVSYNKAGGSVEEIEVLPDDKSFSMLKSNGLPELQICSFDDGSVEVNGISLLEMISSYAVDVENEQILTVGRGISFRMWSPYISGTTSLKDENSILDNGSSLKQKQFKLSPNITNTDLHVELYEKSEVDFSFEVYSSTGELMQKGVIPMDRTSVNLPVNNLPVGLFLFSTELNGKMVQEKFIIIR